MHEEYKGYRLVAEDGDWLRGCAVWRPGAGCIFHAESRDNARQRIDHFEKTYPTRTKEGE